MHHSWLLLVIVLVTGILPLIPVTAQSACSISTQFVDMPLRSGPGTQYNMVATMRLKTDYAVTERVIEPMAKGRTRVWYHLVPGSAASDAWVGGRVETTEGCATITTTNGAPLETATPVLVPPIEGGNWLVYYYNFASTCSDGASEMSQSTTYFDIEQEDDAPVSASITLDGGTFTGKFSRWGDEFTIKFSQGRRGIWRGTYLEYHYYDDYNVQDGNNYRASLSVESATRLSGKMFYDFTDEDGLACVQTDSFFMVFDTAED